MIDYQGYGLKNRRMERQHKVDGDQGIVEINRRAP
jgi:hypothetical protein